MINGLSPTEICLGLAAVAALLALIWAIANRAYDEGYYEGQRDAGQQVLDQRREEYRAHNDSR